MENIVAQWGHAEKRRNAANQYFRAAKSALLGVWTRIRERGICDQPDRGVCASRSPPPHARRGEWRGSARICGRNCSENRTGGGAAAIVPKQNFCSTVRLRPPLSSD